jgi:hypothetical protein
MYQLPKELQEKIILDSIILKKNNYGWNKIHNYFKHSELHLKKTNNIHSFEMKYEKIKRVVSLCFYNKPYVWLMRTVPQSNMYYYNKPELISINDVYSIDENGVYFDDYIYDDDYDDIYDDTYDD